MSLSSALSNAVSGLNASALEADLIANNIANAQTPGYTRRVAELGAAALGGKGDGVRVVGVTLIEDTAAIANRRRADAGLGAQTATFGALDQLSISMGLPGSGTALAEQATAFETALLAAANDPASDPRLATAVNGAGRLADTVSGLSTETQRLRVAADAEIATKVATVNQNLQSIERLNREIQVLSISGGDASALVDARKTLIDEVSSIQPIGTTQRENGGVALFTANGASLLDSTASTLGFTPTATITQDMTLASGALSGLTLNDRPVSVGEADASGLMDGGSLGALFVTRDTTLPKFANQLDLLAEDLVTRFQDPDLDPTLMAGDPGLFTDAGNAYNPADLEGLAGRLALNAAVDPSQGGAVWRLRDGLGATAQGTVGNDQILSALNDAATTARVPDSALGFTGAGGVADFAAGLTSVVSTQAEQAEADLTYAAAINQSLRDAEVSTSGVDTDRELQQLLRVEQAYAANALVLSTVDEMINRLLEI